MHRELQAQLVEPHSGTWPLAIERQRHLRLIGEIERQVVWALRADSGVRRKHALRRLAERDRDDPLALGHALARAQVERHTGPAPVVDRALERDERLGVGLGVNALLRAVADVLAAHHVGRFDRPHAAEHLVLLLADRPRLERRRRLDRHERKDLEQMRDDHVAIGAGRFVEPRALPEPDFLGHVDLHVVDEVAVPDRLEQTVREPKCEDVLRGLFAKEVVDPKDLFFREHLMQPRIELDGAREVGAERLLHHDARAFRELRVANQPHCCERGARRHAEVVQDAALAREVLLRPVDRRVQRLGPRIERHVIETCGERSPVGRVDFAHGRFVERLARALAEPVRVERVERDADDAALRNETGARQVIEARQQLAARKIAGRADEHDDLAVLGPDPGRNLRHAIPSPSERAAMTRRERAPRSRPSCRHRRARAALATSRRHRARSAARGTRPRSRA